MMELKPCAHCGNDAAEIHQRFTYGSITPKHQVVCECCGMSGKMFDNPKEAVDNWNRRDGASVMAYERTIDNLYEEIVRLDNEVKRQYAIRQYLVFYYTSDQSAQAEMMKSIMEYEKIKKDRMPIPEAPEVTP